MNPVNLFKYLEKEKGRPIPFEVKIVNGLPLTPEELDVKGNLYLYGLPQITFLPRGLKIEESLILTRTPISSLPPDLKVGRHIYLNNTPLAKKSDEEIRAMLTTGYIKGNIFK
jgi:hypothetical protein